MTLVRFVFFILLPQLLTVVGLSQTVTSINNGSVNITPSYTLMSGASYTVTGDVKNTGNTTITSNVHVNVAIDTSSVLGTTKYYWRSTKTYNMSGFAPNATFPFSVSDAATPANGYKINGGGITVVVWTSVGPLPTDASATLDSVFTKIYIIPVAQNIFENEFEETSIHIQNPAHSYLNFDITNNTAIESISLTDALGNLVTEITNQLNKPINIEHLKSGLYYLRFYNKEKNKSIQKKIIIY